MFCFLTWLYADLSNQKSGTSLKTSFVKVRFSTWPHVSQGKWAEKSSQSFGGTGVGGVSLMGENYLQGLLGSPLHLQGKVAQRAQLRGQLPFWDEQGGLLRCSGPRETLVHVCRGPSPPMGCCGVSSLISGSGLGSGKPGVSDFTLPDPNCKKFYFLNCKIRRFNEMNHFQLFLTMERTLLKQNLTHISSYWK